MIHGFVYIIESPSDVDLVDGKTEGRTLCEQLKLSEIPHAYGLATTRKTLELCLTDRLSNVWTANPGLAPILHLSMHGDVNGIGLTNGDYLTWSDLRKLLGPLTRILNNKLLVCMSSCFGAAGCRMAMYEDDEPHFWALVGHSGTATWSDAAIAYSTFYHRFFKETPIEACVAAMRDASGDDAFRVEYGSDTKASWAQYIQKSRTDMAAGLGSALAGLNVSNAPQRA
jgi:hypothetical protein